ncbi:thiamine-phosphate kinase [Marinobacter sp. CHS3-4]|uniref:thiamine-phosphate kinase n=1 Tax=Marinobacter sp. CHS3-4 TaxID=3045174 RepID=UPI0024B540B8|nr:thiamine-phosphate kinase [Marinobacter sp. CHS3-4]MDI9246762.1 thiamine-phosphate kinase [Marinobacter sp. CHS3-4]
MGEFELIRRFFYPVANAEAKPDVLLGPGDDCAIQTIPEGHELVFSMDTLVEGIHFPHQYTAEKLGWRSLASAASDLAAMGATPVCFTLALTLPEADVDWLRAFSKGLSDASRQFGLALVGGDTTRGPLALTLQVHGTVPAGSAIRRSGATSGDLICVSGTLGDAGAALEFLHLESPTPEQADVLNRYHFPEPKLALGQSLRGVATAAIDISDGLVSDLRHLLLASGVAGRIAPETLPLSEALVSLRADARELALYSGDDYELCVTLSEAALAGLPECIREQLTTIGRVHDGEGLGFEGYVEEGHETGYDHFGSVE